MKEADIFSDTLERPLAEREEFLRETCGDDASLLEKVRMLLNIHEEEGGLLDEPIGGLDDFPESEEEHEPPSSREMVNKDGTQILYFGEYQLEGEIARGAMGVVYRAFQNSLKRIVAVKMIRSTMLASEDDVARFRTEAEAAGSLDHPNIVPIYEVGEFQGQHYFSMKLIEGGTLRDHLADLQKDPKATAGLMVKVARAIQAAHQRGVLHRDLKPGNILIDAAGEPHVTDFGLAKQMESVSSATLSGQLMGTPSYMAPEQAESGKDVTTSADVYGLGAIFYELLTGVPPHRGESIIETLKLIADTEPVSPIKHNPKVDRDLQTIAMKCLERDPAKRFPSARDLAEDLERWLRGEPIEARPVGTAEWIFKWMKRKPAQAAAAMLAVLLLLTLGVGGPMVALHQSELKNEALEATNIAEQRAESLRQQMYAFEMIAAAEEVSNPDGIPKIERWIPDPDSTDADLRGWEWYYARAVIDAPVARYETRRSEPAFAWTESNSLLFLDGKQTLSDWEIESGVILNRWRLPPGVDSFGLIHGSDQIKLLSGNQRIRKSLQTAKEELVFDLPPVEYLRTISWSPDGRCVAFCGSLKPKVKNHSVLKIWSEGEDLGEAKTITLIGASSSKIEWSPDGKRYAIAIEPFGDLEVYDAATGQRTRSNNVMGRITNMATLVWSPDGKMIALASTDGEIRVVSADELTPAGAWTKLTPPGTVNTLAWSPDGTRLVSGGDDRIARIWEIRTGKEVLSLRGHDAPITTLAWSPDGRWIASGERGGEVRIWNATEDSRPANIQSTPPMSVNTVAWHPDRESIAIAVNQAPLSYAGAVLELPSRRIVPKPGPYAKCLDWGPFGKRLAVGRLDGGGDLLQISGIEKGSLLWEAGPGTWQLAWAPDGGTLAAMPYEGDLLLHQGDDGSVLRTIKALAPGQRTERPTHQFRFSPDGRTLAWGQKSGDLAFFDPTTGELQREIKGHTARIAGVDWTGDSAKIATASEDHTARIWDTASGETLWKLIGHSASVIDLRWSPDESRLATASLDGTVRLWNPATGAEVARYLCPAAMRGVDWSPDGTRLIAGGDAGIVLFDARPGLRVEALKSFHQHSRDGEWDAAAGVAREILERFSNETQSGWLQTEWWHRQGAEIKPFGKNPSSWKWRGEGAAGSRIDLGLLFGTQGDQTTWLTTRVFSPREQSIRLHLSGPAKAQVWHEGQLVLEIGELNTPYPAKTGELILKEGWNTLTLRPFRWEEGDLMNLTLFR